MKKEGKIEQYLARAFGWSVKVRALGDMAKKLPYGMAEAADYTCVSIEGEEFIAVWPKAKSDFRTIKNLVGLIQKRFSPAVILILDEIDTYRRCSLIKNRINFIVPDKQIYLPSVGILLTERGLNRQSPGEDSLSMVATVIIIYHIVKQSLNGLNISDIAGKIGYSVKSVSLAVCELEKFEIIKVTKAGRIKEIDFISPNNDLWDKAYPLMESPVEKKLYTSNVPLLKKVGIKASDTALSEISALTPSRQKIYAVYYHNKSVKELNLNADDGECEVELWKFNPEITATDKRVDSLSLALSYKRDDDPRVNVELEKIITLALC